ncbi:hypothetical protein MUK42_34691 [Musa troglodytarum]|uniref:Uncharacterized protein n=1 Tax=Musa troglodytarum TaxID=320322 RepID=A0A9E7KRX5_9LILI|nr:hypothetical protein MUK42_34691 [Musa troglodytarum]
MQAIAVSTTHLLIDFFIITTSRDFQEISSDIKVVFNFYTWTTGWFFFHIPCATNWGRSWDFILYIRSKFVSRRFDLCTEYLDEVAQTTSIKCTNPVVSSVSEVFIGGLQNTMFFG